MMVKHFGARGRARLILSMGVLCSLFGASTSPAYALSGDTTAHDPTIIKSGSCYYTFSTGEENGYNQGNIQIRRSCNLTSGWTGIGIVFNTIPFWIPLSARHHRTFGRRMSTTLMAFGIFTTPHPHSAPTGR